MSCQSFGIGYLGSGVGDGLNISSSHTENIDHFDEIEHVYGRGETRRSPGGHDMARPHDVISQRLGGHFPQKYAARVLNVVNPGHRILYDETEVLRAVLVGQGNRLLERTGQDYSPSVAEGLYGDVLPGQIGKLLGDFDLGPQGDFGGRREQDGGGKHVVLRLGDQIGGNPPGPGGVIGDNEGLGRTRQAVDPHLPVQLPLRQHDEQVTGTNDLVHPRDCPRTVGEGGNGLSATDLVDGVHFGDAGRNEYSRVDPAFPVRRCGDDHLPDTGYPGRDGGHEHR